MGSVEDTLFEMPETAYVRRRCTVCGVALSIIHEYTYVVQRQWWVKIGGTDRPRQRVNELSRPDWCKYVLSPAEMDWSEPLTVWAMIGGDIEHETHRLFADAHVIGEWFDPTPEMRAWIEELT